MTVHDLGDLADPSKLHEPLDLSGSDPSTLRSQLAMMARIRSAERWLADRRKDGTIGGPVHLGVGQEAIAAGVSTWLRRSDRVFGGHRSHSHLLALGGSLRGLFAEVLGKETGLSKGFGGSMHLWDQPRGFYGSVPIVAGTVPLAVGAALAAKLQGTDDVAVAYFGDGAVEEGAIHESLNLARVLKVPMIFVVENNLFSSHMHIDLRQPCSSTARFATAHDIKSRVVDGNDVVAVTVASEQLIAGARRGEGPGFLEAVTFRWYGHVDWRDDIDVGVNRSMDDLNNWRRRDPIERLRSALDRAGLWSAQQQAEMTDEIDRAIRQAWSEAMADRWPTPESLLDNVYARGDRQ
jgi:TPP-dependent pyruvate/acetoin dehydrogenase alpha subunit